MTRKPAKLMHTVPLMSSSDYEAAVVAFIRDKGVTRCRVHGDASAGVEAAAAEVGGVAQDRVNDQRPAGIVRCQLNAGQTGNVAVSKEPSFVGSRRGNQVE